MKIIWLAASILSLSGLVTSTVSSLSGCVMPSASSDAGTVSTGDGGALGSDTSGTGCGTDPTTGVTLCVGASECPSISVDQSVFPECGFYFTDGSVYLACLCSNFLCPIGQPATCDQAASLLQSTNEGTVCGETASNGCTEVSSGAASTSAGMGTTTPDGGSGCDMTCESDCAGEPDCIQLCGC
jgi:hypothetical protein